MKVAEAVVDFIGDFASVDAGLGLIPGKAAPIAKKLGSMFGSSMSVGIIAGFGAITTVGGLLTQLSAPLQTSQVDLQNAIKNTGNSWDAYSGKVKGAVQTEEK